MPDEPIARMEERLAALAHRLDRAETTCERRASEHVGQKLYDSQRQSVRDDINNVGRQLSQHEQNAVKAIAEIRADLALARREAFEATSELTKKIQRDRQWAIGLSATVLLTLLGYLVAVLT